MSGPTDPSTLLMENIGLIHKAANGQAQKHGQWFMLTDLVQAAAVGFLLAAETWDEEQGSLATHTWPWMHTYMARLAQAHGAFRGFSLPHVWFEDREWRKQNPVPKVRGIDVDPDAGGETWEPGWDGGIERLLDTIDGQVDILAEVRPVIAALEPHLRDALIAWWDHGSLTEAGRVLGIDKGAVKNRVGKAMKIIRSALPHRVEGEQAVKTRADERKERHVGS